MVVTQASINDMQELRFSAPDQWSFVGKGWVDSHACCGVTDEMIEQFKRLDRFLYYRLHRFSNPCRGDGEEGLKAFKDMGLRSFMGALNDFKRRARQRRRQRRAAKSPPGRG